MNLDPKVWGTVFPELLDTIPPIGTRPILGFRINQIRPFRLALTGFGPKTYFWQPGKNVATCPKRGLCAPDEPIHRAPAPGCGCGLYACHDLSGVLWAVGADSKLLVLTAVAGTGIIRIHERGWRAEFARIVAFSDELPVISLWRLGGAKVSARKVIGSDVARALEKKYQVPVVPLKKLAEVMRGAGDFLEGQP